MKSNISKIKGDTATRTAYEQALKAKESAEETKKINEESKAVYQTAIDAASRAEEMTQSAKETLGEATEYVLSYTMEHTVDDDGVLGIEKKFTETAEVLRKIGMLGMAGFPGVGKFSEIFNDYERNIAGIMGYYWSDVDFSGENPVITFSRLQGIADSEEFEIDYEVGDLISIVNGNHWTDCSTILAISKNRVTVDNLPFDKVEVPTAMTHDDYSVFVVAKPFAGTIKLGQFAHAEGENTQALERASFTAGRDTKSPGQYGFAINRETVADYCAFAGGNRAKALGKTCFSFGSWSQVLADGAYGFGTYSKILRDAVYSFIAGYYLTAASPSQTIFGKYNEIDYDGIYAFMLGNGTVSKRSNAFTTDWSGNGWFKGDIKTGGKNASDPNAKTVLTREEMSAVFATYTLETLVEGITANISIKPLYDVDADAYEVVTDGVLWGERTDIGGKVRISVEALKSDKTHVIFYGGGKKKYETVAVSTISGCGMLFVVNE